VAETATVTLVLGRAGRLAALGAVGLLSLLLAAAEPRAVNGSIGVGAAIDHYVAEAAVVTGSPTPRVKPTQAQPISKRTALRVAGLAVAVAAVFASWLLGATPTERRARRPRWRRGWCRAPPAVLSA
jgi:hypothetical protein